MIDILTVLLIIIVGYIIYILVREYRSEKFGGQVSNNKNNKVYFTTPSKFNKPKSSAVGNRNHKDHRDHRDYQNYRNNRNQDIESFDGSIVDNIVDDIVSWDPSENTDNSGGKIYRPTINPNFLDTKFHNDYRDVITAINNLIPDKKQIFNIANVPLVYSEPEASEIKNMVLDFTKAINENVKTQVPSERNPNTGWDEAVPDANIESGWDTVQRSLGLQPTLWGKPADKAPVKLIAIPYVQKYETEDEVKFSCDLILQKVNVADQMVLKCSFVQDKRPLRDENNFFVTKNIDMLVTIEDIYIKGYMSRDGNDARLMFDKDMEKFYDYNEMEYNNMTDPKYIQKILMEKYKQRTQEMEQRNAMLDEEGQSFHRQLPHIYDFSNIKGTRTIFDDMNTHKTFY